MSIRLGAKRMIDACIEVSLALIELGDVIESHDSEDHEVTDWSEKANGEIELIVTKSNGEGYSFTGRPGEEISIYT